MVLLYFFNMNYNFYTIIVFLKIIKNFYIAFIIHLNKKNNIKIKNCNEKIFFFSQVKI